LKHIACFSGGKDSLAMLLLIKERGLPLDKIIHVGIPKWEWEEVPRIIKKTEDIIGMEIITIDIQEKINDDFEKYGFPNFKFRWCTGDKNQAMRLYIRDNFGKDVKEYVGIAYDEIKRKPKAKRKITPLIDYKITEKKALQKCKDYGFDFGGIYNHHSHLNCWCCPLQRIGELEYIYKKCPEKWEILKGMQSRSEKTFRDKSIFELEERFINGNSKAKKGIRAMDKKI
jgi:3'-phosphoadenosine 5'-phosphosulfate sulfotransferase (PAPS reductase)/FAD synthetase